MRYGRKTVVELEEDLEYKEVENIDEFNEWEDYKIVNKKRDGGEVDTYVVRSKFFVLETTDYVVNNDSEFGEFPFNVIKQSDKYDIDVEVSTDDTDNEGNQLVAVVKIYNPPKKIQNLLKLPRSALRVGDNITLSRDYKKTINIKSGYYGMYGEDIPTIYSGAINSYRYEFDEDTVILELEGTSDPNMNILAGKTKYNDSLGNVIENVCGLANVNIGYLPKFVYDVKNEIKYILHSDGFYIPESEDEKLLVVDFESDGESVVDVCQTAIKKANKKYGTNFELDVSMGNINVFPGDFYRYSGIQITPSSGLISFEEQEEMDEQDIEELESSSIDMKETDNPDWKLETLFLPEIMYGDVIKFRENNNPNEKEGWNYIKVTKFSHNIPNDDTATTTIEGNNISVKPTEETYEHKTVQITNPYEEPERIYDVYSLNN